MMLNISKHLDINNYKYTTKLVELKGSFRKKSTDQSKCFKKTAQNFWNEASNLRSQKKKTKNPNIKEVKWLLSKTAG